MAVGFFVISIAPNVVAALFGAALAAVGGSMGDLMILAMVQSAIPEEHMGKAYSLGAFCLGLGSSIGLFFAPFVFHVLSASQSIQVCASLMALCGIAGLLRFTVVREN
jgi:MFS family permease